MASNFFGSTSGRPLFIDFDTYTDGDNEFKMELIELMIDNLHELQALLRTQNVDAHLFHKVCHKIKPTLDMLADKELLDTVEQLKVMITDPARLTFLDKLCVDIIESLKKE